MSGTNHPAYKAITGDVGFNSAGVATIANLAVTAAKLAAEAVETAKIKGEAVTEGKLANLAVTAAKLANEAVETGKIKALAVTTAKVAAEAITDEQLASPNNVVYRHLRRASGLFAWAQVAGTYILGTSEGAAGAEPHFTRVSGQSLNTIPGAAGEGPPVLYFVPADYAVANKTTKLRVRGWVGTNGTKPALKFTFGLYPVTFSGGENQLIATLGAVVASSQIEINEPAANGTTKAATADFAIPAEGIYALGVITSAKLTANAVAQATAELQVRNV